MDAIKEPVSVEVLQDLAFRALESSPDAIVIAGEDRRIVVFNTQAELMFGYHRAEAIGETVEFLIPEDLRAKHEKLFAKYVEQPMMRLMGMGRVVKVRRRGGQIFDVELAIAPLAPIVGSGLFIMAVIRRLVGVRP